MSKRRTKAQRAAWAEANKLSFVRSDGVKFVYRDGNALTHDFGWFQVCRTLDLFRVGFLTSKTPLTAKDRRSMARAEAQIACREPTAYTAADRAKIKRTLAKAPVSEVRD